MSLIIDNLSMDYGSTKVFAGVSATIAKGEFLSILGPSGCGKSTLLKILAGFVKPTGGRVLLDNELYSDRKLTVPPEERDMGMVFQSFALWPHMTVRQHVEFPLECRRKAGMSPEEKAKAVDEALEMTGLTELQNRYPDALSGGQRQRVSLARAISAKPALLLMDEPLSALDADLRVSMRKEIRRIHRLIGTTVVFVTHDQSEALSLSDRVMLFYKGGIEQIGTPEEIYLQPKTKFTASFIGRCNFIEGSWQGDTFTASVGNFTYTGKAAEEFKREGLCPLRPEQLRLSRVGPGIKAKVLDKQYMGRDISYLIRAEDGKEYNISAEAGEEYTLGQEVVLSCF